MMPSAWSPGTNRGTRKEDREWARDCALAPRRSQPADRIRAVGRTGRRGFGL